MSLLRKNRVASQVWFSGINQKIPGKGSVLSQFLLLFEQGCLWSILACSKLALLWARLCQSGLWTGFVTQVLCWGEGFCFEVSSRPGWCQVGSSAVSLSGVDAPCVLLTQVPRFHFCLHLMFLQFYCVLRPTQGILLSAPVIKYSQFEVWQQHTNTITS